MIITNLFKLYEDEELTKEIGDMINFGEVFAGDTVKKTIYLKNVKEAFAENLVFEAVPVLMKNNQMLEVNTGEKIKVVESPTSVKPGEQAKVTFEWTARIDLEQSLEAKLKISGYAVYKPRL